MSFVIHSSLLLVSKIMLWRYALEVLAIGFTLGFGACLTAGHAAAGHSTHQG